MSNLETEKLREKIIELLCEDDEEHIMADQILKACKETGLMFTKVGVKGGLQGACICKVEEIVI